MRQPQNLFTDFEINVLQLLCQRSGREEQQISEISEIAVATGIKNNEEVQRALYVLEGRSLVAPEPMGDLTSKHWRITDTGQKALQLIAA